MRRRRYCIVFLRPEYCICLSCPIVLATFVFSNWNKPRSSEIKVHFCLWTVIPYSKSSNIILCLFYLHPFLLFLFCLKSYFKYRLVCVQHRNTRPAPLQHIERTCFVDQPYRVHNCHLVQNHKIGICSQASRICCPSCSTR